MNTVNTVNTVNTANPANTAAPRARVARRTEAVRAGAGEFGGFATASRACSYGGGMLHVQDVRLDPVCRRAWLGEAELRLSRMEFDLLHALIARAGRIVSRDELMREVWHASFWTSSKTIDVHVGWVRRKLGDDSQSPRLITTVRGRGLRFEIGQPEQGPAG